MVGFIARIFLVISGVIAGWFVVPSANNFDLIQLAISTLLFALFVGIAAFWPSIKQWFKKDNKK